MQQVKSTGFRLGSTGWLTSLNERNNSLVSWRVTSEMRKAMARRGALIINSYEYFHRSVYFCPIIYYRYQQRSRLRRWLVGYLNRREGIMSPPNVRAFVLRKNNPDSLKGLTSRLKKYKRAFPKAGVKGWSKEAKLSKKMRGWVDLEFKTYEIVKKRNADNMINQSRDTVYDMLSRAEFRAYNLFDFVPIFNHLKALRDYIFQRFNKLLYQADVRITMYIATQLNYSHIFAHAMVIGRERHAGKLRKQRRFIGMVRVMRERIIMWKTVEHKPIWRISIYGKIDAKMRRTHQIIKVGFMRYQEVDFITNYSMAISRTKYGTSSVRVWMRNFLK